MQLNTSYLNEVFCTFCAPGICLYTSLSWTEEQTALSHTVVIHTSICLPNDKRKKRAHIIGHFLAELFGISGFRARQILGEQPVQPEGDRELDYKAKEEPQNNKVEFFSSKVSLLLLKHSITHSFL